MTNKVLCVDDDANVLTGIQRNLRRQFDIDTAVGALAALKLIERECPYAVIVADMQMPGMNGVEFLNLARQKYPDTVRIMLTGNADQKTATEAVNRGHIFQFLNKPCPPDKLADVLVGGIKQYRLITAERELLENTLNGSVNVLLEILSFSDPATFGRSQIVRDHARQIGPALGVTSLWELELAAMLAQIGTVSVPPIVSQKARAGLRITGEERDVLNRVPQVSSDLLAKIPRLQGVARIVRYTGKHFDGTGFPFDDVKGPDLPLESRLIKALTDLAQQDNGKIPRFKVLEQMRAQPGVYDATVLDAIARHFELTAAPARPLVPRAVSFSELRPGHLLAAEICTVDGVMVVSAGTKLTPLIMERLRNFASLSGLKEPIHIEA
jgi:response regulator RpfG family c-di-GMP phosphodiesterase